MKIKLTFLLTALCAILVFCTKDRGKNPSLAFTDQSLLDSCKQNYHTYYKNDGNTLLAGSPGPHGAFKLRFNSVAFKVLTSNGKLPVGSTFPEGSFIIKDIYSGNDISLYAFMYKKSGSWLWGEVKPNGDVLYSVNKNPSACIGCHSQTGNRDLVLSFSFY